MIDTVMEFYFHPAGMTVQNPLVALLCSATCELCSHSYLMKMKYAVLPAIRNPLFMNTRNAEFMNVYSTGSSVVLQVHMKLYTACS